MSFNILIQEKLPYYAKAIPFTAHHINFLKLDKYQSHLMNNIKDYKDWFVAQSKMGHSATVTVNDKPTVCFGFIPLWKGVAEAWMLVDTDIRTNTVPFARVTKHIFVGIGSVMGLHRLQMYIQQDNKRAIRYAEYCKFVQEGLLKKYSPVQDNFYVYGRLYE